ncbi:MAG TPA: serine hydrolase [Flavobacteriaceae bacterium]|nr:serine hydrolase [Flavobacteriaceae bacterium]
MTILIYLLTGLLILIILGLIILLLTGNQHILRGIQVVYLKGYTSTYINDWPQFDNRLIKADASPENKNHQWELAEDYNRVKPTESLQNFHEKMGTVAFLIFKNDQIWYEDYAEGYGTESKTNSFSMAKSITTALLGKAIEEGHIKSLDQKVSDFFEEIPSDLTVGDLASMASGMDWNEDYDNPFSSVARIYLLKNVRKYMLSQTYKETPGKSFEYNSGNTQLLGMLIEKATGKHLADYLSEHFWKPLGMQEDALWELDSNESAMEKAYCCISSNARDFARFGKLFKNGGKWNDKQLLSPEFVEKCIHPRFEESPEYGYGFWLSNYRNKDIFVMQGILGQYVITIPEDDLMIVRLGHKRGVYRNSTAFTEDFFTYIDEAYEMLAKQPAKTESTL